MDYSSLNIPAGFENWAGDPAEDHIGPFFFRLQEGKLETAFRISEKNLNSAGNAHGGCLMTFADYTLCVTAINGTNDDCVTVSCNSEFVDAALPGDLVIGEGILTRRTGSLAFTQCILRVEDRIVMTASAIIKRIRNS